MRWRRAWKRGSEAEGIKDEQRVEMRHQTVAFLGSLLQP